MFLIVRCLGHLLVNPERLEKGYKEMVVYHDKRTEGNVLEKSPVCNYSPTSYYLFESSSQNCSRILSSSLFFSFFSFLIFIHTSSSFFLIFIAYFCDDSYRLQVHVVIRKRFDDLTIRA